MAIKCKITGKHKRLPTDKGACPECTTPEVKLTGKGFVGAHDVKIHLGDGPQIAITDEGSRVGDPRDAAVRREVEGNKIRAGVETTPRADVPDPVMTTGHGRGPTLVKGRNMPPVQAQTGFAAAAGTMYGPLGRERFDREIIGERPKAHRTASQRSNWRKKQRRLDTKNA